MEYLRRQQKGGSILVLLAVTLGFLTLAPRASAKDGQQLIVFLGDGKHRVEKAFVQKVLPQIKEMAKTMDLEVVERNVSKGAPAEVLATPAIFFQNHLGRSQFIGRYTMPEKLRTFVNTVRRLPQGKAQNEKHDVLVWQRERAVIYSPIKLSKLDGTLPAGHDEAAFHTQALAAFASGAKSAKLQPTWLAERGHRAMYLALYPYRDEQGNVFVSAELYSQFNCVDPLYRRFDNPFKGTWKNWQAVLQEAGEALQSQIMAQLDNPAQGDGLVPVPLKVATKTWDQLGLALPKAAPGSASAVADVALPRRWTFGGPLEPGSSVLNFAFLAPVDAYAGEIKELFGGLELGEGAALTGTVGKFGVQLSSLTMGDPGLDSHVKEMIMMVEHPQAYFNFQSITVLENAQVKMGQLSQFSVRGELDFMGVKAPVDVVAQMEPGLDAQGVARIAVQASFGLRLKEAYNLDGPEGPMPAKDSMQFLLNFLLIPA